MGSKIKITFVAVCSAVLSLVCATPSAAQTGYYFSTGDNQMIGHHMPVDSEAVIDATFEMLQDVYGVNRVYWRGLQTTQITDSLIRPEAALTAYHFNWQSDLMDRQLHLNEAAVQSAHSRGMEIWGEAAMYDWGTLGTDSSNLLGWPGISESYLRLDNPQWVPIDRFGVRRQSGPIEFGYTEARTAVSDWIYQAATDVGYDGVMLHTFAENYSARYTDEFGFNDPVVEDFYNLHGVDIRRDSFNVADLRDLRGSYTTQFLQTLSTQLSSQGIELGVGINGDDADQAMMWLAGGSPFPLAGNMTMQWQQWVDQGLVDELQFGQNYNGADAGTVVNYANANGVDVSALAGNPYDPGLDYLKNNGVAAVGTGTTLEQFMRESTIPPQTLAALNSTDKYERMRILGQIIDGDSTATVAQISPLLNDESILVRRMAVKALGATGGQDALTLLENALFDADSAISTAAAYAMRLSDFNAGQSTVNKMLQAMAQSGSAPLLEESMGTMVLSDMDKGMVASAMLDALANNSNVDARRLAARTLWNLGGGPNYTATLQQTLINALNDSDAFVRYYAAAIHSQVVPSNEMLTALLQAAQDTDTVVAMRAVDSLGEMFDIGYLNAVARKTEVVGVLENLFKEYGDHSTRPNADWGYEVIGRSLQRAGAEGTDALRTMMQQREDRLLSERAWSILYIPNTRGAFDLTTFEDAEWAYLRRPRWDAVMAMADSFDSATNGQTLSSYSPEVGESWEVIYGDPNLQIIQSNVTNGDGMALELRREQNNTTSHGVRMAGHVYDGGVSEQTTVTLRADWMRDDANTFAWMILDLGGATADKNPAIIAHTQGNYWVTSPEGTINTGVAVGMDGWETLELVLTWGIAENDMVQGMYDVYLTRDAENTLGKLDRMLIAEGISVSATEIGTLQQLVLLNDDNPFGDAVTYWDNISLFVQPIPEPTSVMFIASIALLLKRNRNSRKDF